MQLKASGFHATSDGGDQSDQENLMLPTIGKQKQMSDSGSKTSRNISKTVISKANQGQNLNTSRIYSDQ